MRFTSNGNNSWLFQKGYYHEFRWADKKDDDYAPGFFKTRLDQLKSVGLTQVPRLEETTPVRLKVLYPGLVTGIGVKHESTSTGELKLGFEFDYSTGMPVIRGHSLKGALRSAFPQDHRRKIRYKLEKAFQISCWLNNEQFSSDGLNRFKANPEQYHKIVAFEEEIFDGKIEGKLISNYRQDVFLDSYISAPSHFPTTFNQYLGGDSITPHVKREMSYERSMLKNPVPIMFLKMLPGVELEFRFILHENGLLSMEQKNDLLTKILVQNGIGAKTNVGYGQLDSD